MIKCRLRVLMAERELTPVQVAEVTGLHYATITALAAGRTHRYDDKVLSALCRYFDVQPGELLRYVPDEPKKR